MIQVIVRAIDILKFVAQHGQEPVKLIKIAAHAGLSQPTTANIVKTLVEENYLEQLGRKKGYCLGIGAYQLTGNPSYQQHLIIAAKEPMEELTKQLNETAILAMVRNNKRVVVHIAECNQVLQVRPIMMADIYDTSTGRLLMAYLSDTALDNLLKAIGLPSKKIWPGAETKTGLTKALNKIREAAFVQFLSIYHTVGFAVPIYKDKIVIAGLSIFVPESRYTELHKEKISKLIKRTAKKITERLQKSTQT